MMTHAHIVADVLAGREHRWNLYGPEFLDKGQRHRYARMIERAERLVFTNIPFEPVKDASGDFTTPHLTPIELSFFRDGLIPLPASVCWCEFQAHSSSQLNRDALLIWEEASKLYVARWCLQHTGGRQLITMFGPPIFVDRAAPLLPDGALDVIAELRLNEAVTEAEKERILQAARRMSIGSSIDVAIYMMLMINSKTSDRAKVCAPKYTDQKRRDKGRAMVKSTTIIDVAPARYRSEEGTGRKGTGAGGSKRLHWRRSHKRHYDHQVPSAKYFEQEEHDGVTGWWVGIIPRHLVGHAELGTISHEYRLHNEPEPANVL